MSDSQEPSIPVARPAAAVNYLGIVAAVVFGIVIGVALVSDRQPKERQVPESRLVSTENSIKDLRSEFEKYRDTQQRLADLEADRSSTRLDSSTKAYSFLSTNLGPLMVSVQDVQPYADGQRFTLKIGNPSAADYVGFKARFSYADGIQTKEEDSSQLGSVFMSIDLNVVGLR